MSTIPGVERIEHIVENFEFLDDWDTRYQFLIELGEALPTMPAELKIEENWVKPCMSTVHVAALADPLAPGVVRFVGDCDTSIIKGVVALLIDLLSNCTLEEIQCMDVDRLFKRLRLEEHFSPKRHVGIYAIVDKMVERAEAVVKARH
jgi:cysteine desulfuration protein SufE